MENNRNSIIEISKEDFKKQIATTLSGYTMWTSSPEFPALLQQENLKRLTKPHHPCVTATRVHRSRGTHQKLF